MAEKPPPYPSAPPDSYHPGAYHAGGSSYQSGAPPAPIYSGPPGYQPVPKHDQPSYLYPQGGGSSSTVLVAPAPNVIIVGGCPACRVGVLHDDFTCLGICCAILFFPLGILCCLALKQRCCNHCGAVFG